MRPLFTPSTLCPRPLFTPTDPLSAPLSAQRRFLASDTLGHVVDYVDSLATTNFLR